MTITAQIDAAARKHQCTASAKKLKNGQQNQYNIDCVVCDSGDNPVVIVDIKYIRYKKHNRDKGSWLCTAHYNLRKSYPTIRKSIAVLFGRWSAPSKSLMRNFGIDIYEIPFDRVVSVLAARGVAFDWQEKDAATPAQAWSRFQALPYEAQQGIGDELSAMVLPDVLSSVEKTLKTDIRTVARTVREVEVLLKTTNDEFILQAHSSVRDAINSLLPLLTDKPDIGPFPR